MNKRRLTKCVTALLMIVVFMAGAMPALATPPDRFTVQDSGSYIVAECDGFDVIDEYSGWFTVTDFYNEDGDLERSTFHATMHDRIYNSATGFEVKNTYAFNQDIDPDTNEFFIRGLAYNITVPGYGIVYFDAGLGIYVLMDGEFVEVKFSGNYQADTAILCQAMDQ
jgi:hypothetical protein